MTVKELVNKFYGDVRISVDVINDGNLYLGCGRKHFEEYAEKYGNFEVVDFKFDGRLRIKAVK